MADMKNSNSDVCVLSEMWLVTWSAHDGDLIGQGQRDQKGGVYYLPTGAKMDQITDVKIGPLKDSKYIQCYKMAYKQVRKMHSSN